MKTEKMTSLRRFHNIVSNQSSDFDKKVDELLGFGLSLFQLDVGMFNRIVGNECKILNAVGNIAGFKVNNTLDLTLTYCEYTVNKNEVVGFHHVGASELANHKCYKLRKIEAYLAAPVIVNGNVFGTIRFSSSKPTKEFDIEHYEYIELFAQWLGSEIARKRYLIS